MHKHDYEINDFIYHIPSFGTEIYIINIYITIYYYYLFYNLYKQNKQIIVKNTKFTGD